MGKRFAILIGVAAAGVMALGAGAVAVPALAGQTVKIDSKVTLAVGCADLRGGQCYASLFHGRVESSKHACEVQREVRVFSEHRRGDGLVGKDKTNRHGKWKVVAPPHPGFYYAKVLRREEGTAGTTFVCRGDRSETFDFH